MPCKYKYFKLLEVDMILTGKTMFSVRNEAQKLHRYKCVSGNERHNGVPANSKTMFRLVEIHI
jgi:hypothetical protein